MPSITQEVFLSEWHEIPKSIDKTSTEIEPPTIQQTTPSVFPTPALLLWATNDDSMKESHTTIAHSDETVDLYLLPNELTVFQNRVHIGLNLSSVEDNETGISISNEDSLPYSTETPIPILRDN